MGTSKSAGEMVAKLGKYQDTIPAANRKAVEAVALVVKTRILLRATPATGGDLKLSGTKNKRVGVRYKLQGERAEIKADGPMHWLEGPAPTSGAAGWLAGVVTGLAGL